MLTCQSTRPPRNPMPRPGILQVESCGLHFGFCKFDAAHRLLMGRGRFGVPLSLFAATWRQERAGSLNHRRDSWFHLVESMRLTTQYDPIICSQQVDKMVSSPLQLEVLPCILTFALIQLIWIRGEFRRSHCDVTGRDKYNCTKKYQIFQVRALLLQLSQMDSIEHLFESNR